MLGLMDATQAIADLTEISPQVREVVVIAADGSIGGANVPTERADLVADAARKLLAGAGEQVAQLEAATAQGSVFVVRDGDRVIAATTSPEPTVGLVFYDLKSCLRGLSDGEPEKPKRQARRRRKEEDGDAA
jgi:predicted regulator of Ras-like GTPase activity (Roadblock/LC7/MglB family)